MNKDLKLLLVVDFLLRLIGISCFTLFIAAVYQLTGKTSDIGFIGVATVGPSLLVMLLAGKYTHYLSPLGTLRWATFLRIILFLLAAFFVKEPVGIMIAAAIQSLSHQVSISAKMSLDAEVVDDDTRRSYIAKKMMLANIAVVVGPPLGGVLISSFGLSVSLFMMLGVSSLVVGLLMLVSMPGKQSLPSEQEDRSVFASLRHLITLPQTAAIVIIFCLISVILEVQAPLLFPFVSEVYAAKSDFTGLLLGLCGLGGILGAVLAERYPGYFTESSIPWLVIIDGTLFLIFTQLRNPIVASILFTTLGMMGAITLIIVESAVQKNVASAHRPFVFSLMQFAGGAGGATLGMVAAFIAEMTGAKLVLAWAAGIEIVFGILCLAGVYRLWRNSSGFDNGGK